MYSVETESVKNHLGLLSPDEVLDRFSPDEVLNRFSSDDRLKGLTPEDRLKGISPEEIELYLKNLGKKREK
ncbi:MAG: hypothetical protein D3906_16710 [Candidatus Electrothrix sp. AUS1_2]|nr:hypothetical protein [Candidatus Electrothrix sp. AUS1_2]